MRVDSIQGLIHLGNTAIDWEWTERANILWALWRCRNERMYAGTEPTFKRFMKLFNEINMETKVGMTYNMVQSESTLFNSDVSVGRCNTYSCYVDGSWMDQWSGGIDYIIFKRDLLIEYCSAAVRAYCPAQAEAITLVQAMENAASMNINSCMFYIDCQVLATSCTSLRPPMIANWRAFKEFYKSLELFKIYKDFDCTFIHRESNMIADSLAKLGRENGWDYSGFTFSLFLQTFFMGTK